MDVTLVQRQPDKPVSTPKAENGKMSHRRLLHFSGDAPQNALALGISAGDATKKRLIAFRSVVFQSFADAHSFTGSGLVCSAGLSILLVSKATGKLKHYHFTYLE